MAAVLYGQIVVGTDGSPTAAAAVDRAVALAAATGDSLAIVSVGSNASRVVASEAARHAGSGVTVTTEAYTGDAAVVLVDISEREGCGLLVVGNKGMTGAARFFLGSVPNKVSHHAPCSVLIIRTVG